jgi:hypothetical protein
LIVLGQDFLGVAAMAAGDEVAILDPYFLQKLHRVILHIYFLLVLKILKNAHLAASCLSKIHMQEYSS